MMREQRDELLADHAGRAEDPDVDSSHRSNLRDTKKKCRRGSVNRSAP
jgi:hypothetical protein